MELRQLRYFLAVAQELHFGRAAEKVHIAQSPLSRQIRQLEDSLGVKLFNRTRHRVELTEAGRAFVAHARAVLATTEQARQGAVKAAAGLYGRVSIGYTNSAIYTLFPQLLVQHRRTHPQVEIVLRDSLLTPMQIDALIDRKLDIGFLRPPVGNAAIESFVVARQTLLMACPAGHPLLQNEEVDLSRFADQPFVMFSRGLDSALTTTMLRVCHEAGFHPHIEQEVGVVPPVGCLVAHGMGGALVPSSAREMEFRGVEFRNIKGVDEELVMAMAWNREVESPARDSFIKLVKAFVEQERT